MLYTKLRTQKPTTQNFRTQSKLLKQAKPSLIYKRTQTKLALKQNLEHNENLLHKLSRTKLATQDLKNTIKICYTKLRTQPKLYIGINKT